MKLDDITVILERGRRMWKCAFEWEKMMRALLAKREPAPVWRFEQEELHKRYNLPGFQGGKKERLINCASPDSYDHFSSVSDFFEIYPEGKEPDLRLIFEFRPKESEWREYMNSVRRWGRGHASEDDRYELEWGADDEWNFDWRFLIYGFHPLRRELPAFFLFADRRSMDQYLSRSNGKVECNALELSAAAAILGEKEGRASR